MWIAGVLQMQAYFHWGERKRPVGASNIREVKASFARQAQSCAEKGAAFTSRLNRLLGERLDDTSSVGRRVFSWPTGRLSRDFVPLRCCAGLNLKVRAGEAATLSQYYPPRAPVDDDRLWSALAETITRHDEWLTAFLEVVPQTNEVGRCGVLLSGFLAIASLTRLPLALHELGASAGLNLIFDKYSYNLGAGRRWGPTGSHVHIKCEWTGEAPEIDAPLTVASRAAVDLRPIRAENVHHRERLLAYIWPEQTERLVRTEAALDVQAREQVRVDSGDAFDWTDARLEFPQEEDTCRVFYHSVFMQYLPEDARMMLEALLHAAGAEATPRRPFAWLAMEGRPGAPHICELRLKLWPGGVERVLAEVDWHGASAQFDLHSAHEPWAN